MRKIQNILSGILSLLMVLTFASMTFAGDKHKEKKSMDEKKLSGVISVEETANGVDYFLTIHPKAKESKTIDIKFSENVGDTRPGDGQRVTVRGEFNEDQFVVKSLNISVKKPAESEM